MIRALKIANQIAKGGATVIFVTGSVTFAYSYFEGYIDPVMGPLTFEDVRQVSNEAFTVQFDGVADKLRACDWVESRWYVGERFAPSVRTVWTFTGPPEVRPTGTLVWPDMTVQMTPEQLFHDSHADVVHKCPWSLWDTVTPFYDSNDDVPLPAYLFKEPAI
tara:strand:- start:778 stop:1263 length:486 start_codon:yes stop_codon:yes gene_type:complete